MFDRVHFSYLCDPAAWIHEGWRDRLGVIGVPPSLARLLWRQEELSLFLHQRFRLGFPPPLDLSDPARRILLLPAPLLEEGLLRAGLLLARERLLLILKGSSVRRWRRAVGGEAFDFARGETHPVPPFRGAFRLAAAREESLARAAPMLSCLSPLDKRHARRLRLKLPPSLSHAALSSRRPAAAPPASLSQSLLLRVFETLLPSWFK